MTFVAVRLQRLLAFARIRDGLLPGRRIRHAFPLLGPAVGDLIVLLGGEHRPHDREATVDVFRDIRRVDLHVGGLDLTSAAGDGVLGARGERGDRSTPAGAALASHGQDIHVRRDAHVAHGTLPGGGGAVTLGTLVDHGNILQDHVSIGPTIHTGLGPGE